MEYKDLYNFIRSIKQSICYESTGKEKTLDSVAFSQNSEKTRGSEFVHECACRSKSIFAFEIGVNVAFCTFFIFRFFIAL